MNGTCLEWGKMAKKRGRDHTPIVISVNLKGENVQCYHRRTWDKELKSLMSRSSCSCVRIQYSYLRTSLPPSGPSRPFVIVRIRYILKKARARGNTAVKELVPLC